MRTVLRVAFALVIAGVAFAEHRHEGDGRKKATDAKKAHLKELTELLANPVCKQTADERKHVRDQITEHTTFNAPEWSPCFDDVSFRAEHRVRPCPRPLFGKIHHYRVEEWLLGRTETGYHPDGSIQNVRCHLGVYVHEKTITCCSQETQTDSDWLPGEVLDDGTPARPIPGSKPRSPGADPPPPGQPRIPPPVPSPPKLDTPPGTDTRTPMVPGGAAPKEARPRY